MPLTPNVMKPGFGLPGVDRTSRYARGLWGAWLYQDGGSGTDLNDASGNARSAVWNVLASRTINPIQYSKFGTGRSYSGSGGYHRVPVGPNPAAPFTAMAVVQQGSPASGVRTILAQESIGRYWFCTTPRFHCNLDGTGRNFSSSDAVVGQNAVVHLTWDGARLKAFLDGVKGFDVATTLPSSSGALNFGESQFSTFRNWTGVINLIAIWSVCWSEGDVRDLAAAPFAPFAPSGVSNLIVPTTPAAPTGNGTFLIFP